MSAHTFKIIFFVGLVVLMQSCLTFKKAPPLPEEAIEADELLDLDEIQLAELEVDLTDTIPTVTLLASIEKTYCYGDCPEFKVDFYTNRRVIYRGFYDVEKVGDFVATIDEKQYQKIIELAERVDFYRLEEYYPVKGQIIDDLPVTITSMDLIYKKNRVTNAHHSPPRLHKFERYLLEVIDYLEWKK